jgi:TetR/AcrR family transcriptional regulator, cholesterol catabolism regulator
MTVTSPLLGDDVPDTTANRMWHTAARLFRERGYSATTTRELAAELGIKKASLYYHMGKKEDLLLGICMAALEHVDTAVRSAVAKETRGDGKIRSLIHAQLNAMLTEIDMHATLLLSLDQLTPVRRRKVVAQKQRYQNLVREVLAEAQEAGYLRNDISADHLALVLLNMLNWTITWYRPNGSMAAPLLADLIAAVFLEGAAAPARPPQRGPLYSRPQKPTAKASRPAASR